MESRTPPRAGTEHFQQTLASGELSSTSAIDLTGTPAGIGSMSGPPSPNLTPLDGSFSRRRLSWGRMERQHVDFHGDPLRINTNWDNSNNVQAANTNTDRFPNTHDDPFDTDTPQEDDALAPHGLRSERLFMRMDGNRTFSDVSLPPSFRSKSTSSSDYNDIDIDDDEARLTSFASGTAGHDRSGLSTHLDPSFVSGMDVERTPDSRTSKRKSARYSTTPSPASRLRSVTRNLRRASLRVVNLASVGLEEKARPIRLPDDKEEAMNSKGKEREREESEEEEEDLPDLATRLPIRGRTLGFLGPTSRLRLTMFRCLTYR